MAPSDTNTICKWHDANGQWQHPREKDRYPDALSNPGHLCQIQRSKVAAPDSSEEQLDDHLPQCTISTVDAGAVSSHPHRSKLIVTFSICVIQYVVMFMCILCE